MLVALQLTDSLSGRRAREDNGKKSGVTILNSAYYHRIYADTIQDASGHRFRFRSFQDQNVFMAETSNPKVPAIEVFTNCKKIKGKRRCLKLKSRWSYAVPLEIVYVSPLSRWNPNDVENKGPKNSKLGLTVTDNGRNGGKSLAKAFDGINSKLFCLTPMAFYNKIQTTAVDPADTGFDRGFGVLKKDGKSFVENAVTGHRTYMWAIPDVGVMRQRYPIFPVVYDGNPIMKEIKAVRDQLKFK